MKNVSFVSVCTFAWFCVGVLVFFLRKRMSGDFRLCSPNSIWSIAKVAVVRRGLSRR